MLFKKISKSKSSFVDEKGELILDQEYQLYKILTIGDTFCHLFVNESGGAQLRFVPLRDN